MQTIAEAATQLRDALSAGRFADVQAFAAEYSRMVTERCQQLPPGDPEAIRIVRDTRELWEWARRMALAQKAQISAHLEALEPLVAYFRAQARETGHTCEVRG